MQNYMGLIGLRQYLFLKIAVPDFCEILHKRLFLLEHICDKDDIAEERQPCYT